MPLVLHSVKRYVLVLLEAFYFRPGMPASGHPRHCRRTMLLFSDVCSSFFFALRIFLWLILIIDYPDIRHWALPTLADCSDSHLGNFEGLSRVCFRSSRLAAYAYTMRFVILSQESLERRLQGALLGKELGLCS